MKKSFRSIVIAAALVSATAGTVSLLAPPEFADRRPRQICGGKPGGNGCPVGYVCVDIPGDHCDPRHGDSDCLGYCRLPRHNEGL
jgi:hypothetical protein